MTLPCRADTGFDHTASLSRRDLLWSFGGGLGGVALASLLGRKLSVLAEADGTGHAGNFARVAVPAGTESASMAISTGR